MSADARQNAESVGHIGGAALSALDLAQQGWIRTGDIDELARAESELVPLQAPAIVHENLVWLKASVRFERDDDADPARDLVGAEDRVTITQWRDMMWIARMSIDAYTVPDRAREAWRRYGDRIGRDDAPMFAGSRSVLNHLIEALAVLGEDDAAASLYVPVKATMDEGQALTPDGVVEMAAGIAASCAARWDVAESHFTGALATAERVPHVVGQCEVRRWHAWMLRRRMAAGDGERAEALLREALAIAERHRLPRRVNLCRQAIDVTL